MRAQGERDLAREDGLLTHSLDVHLSTYGRTDVLTYLLTHVLTYSRTHLAREDCLLTHSRTHVLTSLVKIASSEEAAWLALP